MPPAPQALIAIPNISGNDFWTAVAAIVAVAGSLGTAYAVGRFHGGRSMKKAMLNQRELARFKEIYAPILIFFANCHITTVGARGAPYLHQRLRHSWGFLQNRQPIAAAKAIFDKHDFPTLGEVEYGDDFPLRKITKHLQGKEEFADEKLVRLVIKANRSQYEERPNDRDLTEADLALFSHIIEQHRILSARFT